MSAVIPITIEMWTQALEEIEQLKMERDALKREVERLTDDWEKINMTCTLLINQNKELKELLETTLKVIKQLEISITSIMIEGGLR